MVTNRIQKVITIIIVYRLISWFLVRTYFIADEYWQTFEVSHRLAFSYGYQTWEWKSTHPIRSHLYPLIISWIFRFLAFLKLDTVPMMVYCATLFQTLLAILADLAYLKFLQGHRLMFLIVLCRFTCWYTMYSSPRLIINNVEEIIFIFSLAAAKNSRNRSTCSDLSFHFFASLSFILRPTSIIPFVLIYPYLLYTVTNRFRFLLQAAVVFLVLNIFNILIDSYFYGQLTFVPWNFFYVNFLHPNSISSFYGINHLLWYFTNGLPMIYLYRFPLILLGLKSNKRLTTVIVFTMLIYSLSPHKEFRFLTQILPMAFVIEAHGIDWIFRRIRSKRVQWLFLISSIGHVFIGIYFSTLDRQGQISVMGYLRSNLPTKTNERVLVDFLLPCHSTPFYSFLHRPDVKLDFLTCEPNLNISANVNYVDEADRFFSNPKDSFRERIETKNPTHLVMFNTLYDQLKDFIEHETPFFVKKALFNSHIQHTERHGRMVYVLERR